MVSNRIIDVMGKGLIVCGGGRQEKSVSLIAYHGPDIPQRYVLRKQHYCVLEWK